MTNSREKGKRGERELAAYLRELGYDARRTQQFNGEGLSDVVIDGSDSHIECKFGYPISTFDIHTSCFRDAVEQCERDSAGEQWFLFWKPYRYRQWRMTYPVMIADNPLEESVTDRMIPVTIVGDENIQTILEFV